MKVASSIHKRHNVTGNSCSFGSWGVSDPFLQSSLDLRYRGYAVDQSVKTVQSSQSFSVMVSICYNWKFSWWQVKSMLFILQKVAKMCIISIQEPYPLCFFFWDRLSILCNSVYSETGYFVQSVLELRHIHLPLELNVWTMTPILNFYVLLPQNFQTTFLPQLQCMKLLFFLSKNNANGHFYTVHIRAKQPNSKF